MIRSVILCLVIIACALLTPAPAQAYLLPLIGASGAIATMIIGIGAALLCAVYLVFYNIRRAMKGRQSIAEDDEDDAAKP